MLVGRPDGIYTFDAHLDDSVSWRFSVITCGYCHRPYKAVYRVDRRPNCPRCVPSDRWHFRPKRGV